MAETSAAALPEDAMEEGGEAMDVEEDECFALDDAPEPEAAIGPEYNALHPAGDLPSRALTACGVFEELGARLVMRDLQCLDGEAPPSLDVVGRVVLLTEDGDPQEDAPPGPFVRLTGVRAHTPQAASPRDADPRLWRLYVAGAGVVRRVR